MIQVLVNLSVQRSLDLSLERAQGLSYFYLELENPYSKLGTLSVVLESVEQGKLLVRKSQGLVMMFSSWLEQKLGSILMGMNWVSKLVEVSAFLLASEWDLWLVGFVSSALESDLAFLVSTSVLSMMVGTLVAVLVGRSAVVLVGKLAAMLVGTLVGMWEAMLGSLPVMPSVDLWPSPPEKMLVTMLDQQREASPKSLG